MCQEKKKVHAFKSLCPPTCLNVPQWSVCISMLQNLSNRTQKENCKALVFRQWGNSAPYWKWTKLLEILHVRIFCEGHLNFFKSRLCDLYRGQICSGLQKWLATVEVMWPSFEQNSNVFLTCKISSHLVHWGLSYSQPLDQKSWLCCSPFILVLTICFMSYHLIIWLK